MPGGELERILASIFPEQAAASGGSLGDVDPLQASNNAQVPGLTYQGGFTKQRTGPAGAVARAYSDWVSGIYGGVDPNRCPPPFNSPDCMDVMSRLLEQTFRNFQLAARRPSHIDPPFPARCIDCFDGPVTLPGDTQYAAADFVKVCCFQMPPGKWRGVVVDFGHALEDLDAWSDVVWRVTINSKPIEPYDDIRMQIFNMRLRSKSCHIHLMPQDTICFEAKSLSAEDHQAWVRIFGWYYPVRSESGGMEIRATLVD